MNSVEDEGAEAYDGGPTLARLSDTLRLVTELVQLNPTRENTAHPVTGATLYDRLDSSDGWHNQIVLAVGVSPSGPELTALARRAQDAGAAGVAVKTRGTTIAEIAAAVSAFHIAVLIVRDDSDWGRLATLVRSSALGTSTDSVSGVRLGDIYALANAIASITGGATSIVDPVGRILGYSTLSGQPIDDLRRATTLALQELTPPAYDPDFGTVYAAQRAIRVADTVGGMGRLAIAVRAGDELLATIWTIDPGGDRHTDVLSALDRLAPLAGLHLLHARSGADFGEGRNGDLMRTVLDGGPHAAFAGAQLGIDPAPGLAVVVFDLVRPDRGSLDAVRELHRLLNLVIITCNLHFAVANCALVDSRVYALFPAAGADPRSALSRIAADICGSARAISAHPVLSAAGPSARTVGELPSSKIAAVRTLTLTAGLSPAERPVVALFEDYQARLGLQAVGDFLADSPSHDDSDLNRLREHDRTTGTEYVGTLLAYLRANGNVAASADALHIHNNTARYRIGRLSTEFGLRLDDPDERLWLWLRLAAAG
ncbi:hypothetical protein GCM10027406_27820 [Leifsonia lichenia]